MRKFLFLLASLLFAGSSTYGLSCASFPTFDEMIEESPIAFVGTVTNVNYFQDSSEDEYCSQLNSDLETGTYEFWFDVEETIKGTLGSTTILNRDVNGIHCTRGGACNDMVEGETYVVLTPDGENLNGGLCSPCPYILFDDYVPAPPAYDPADDPTCKTYNDGCNTCSKGENGSAACTKKACFQMGEPFCIETYEKEVIPPYSPSSDPNCRSWSNGCGGCARPSYGSNSLMCTLAICEGDVDYGESVCNSYFKEESEAVCGDGIVEGEEVCDDGAIMFEDSQRYGCFCVAGCNAMLCVDPGPPPLPEPPIENCLCTFEFDPVCGVDGKTYGNACGAGCEQVEIAYPGECTFGEPGGCERGYSGNVCGVDGVTYADICDMEEVGVERAYDGVCVANPNPLNIVDAPLFCTSWHDGCNQCGIENGMLTMCTEKACFTINRAKCTAFDFQVLTSVQEKLIDDIVGRWLTTATIADKDIVIAKVKAKIDEINYTLSVSSFIQGSPALKKFQFVLEVLWKIDSLM